MSATGDYTLDRIVHKANEWLDDLDARFGWQDKHKTYQAARTVLHVLRDRLQTNEAVQLGAQLPTLLRGIYYDGWQPEKTPTRQRKQEDFLQSVVEHYQGRDALEPRRLVEGVFGLLESRVSAGEIDDVKAELPDSLLELWPSEQS
jgi:uncharacterized protein (DUF2267 family)